jgi:SAM-dependent methyltransferase
MEMIGCIFKGGPQCQNGNFGLWPPGDGHVGKSGKVEPLIRGSPVSQTERYHNRRKGYPPERDLRTFVGTESERGRDGRVVKADRDMQDSSSAGPRESISVSSSGLIHPGDEISGAFDCADFAVHNQTVVVGNDPLTVITDSAQWSYSVAFRLRTEALGSPPWTGPCLVRIAATVEIGSIGIIFVAQDLRTTIGTHAEGSPADVNTAFEIRIDSMPSEGWVVVRNNAPAEVPSKFRVSAVRLFRAEVVSLPFPVSVRHRPFNSELVPEGGDTETFDTPEALQLNRARLSHLESLGLPLQNKSVLDVGCGVGHLAQLFLAQNCRVVCLDGRRENIESLRARYPRLTGHVMNVESDLSQFGQFDIVFSYGLLYHLENPIAALRHMAAVCNELLLLETIVCDYNQPLLLLEDETKTFSQALYGIGGRPSPSFVVMALDRIGIPFVYAPKIQPDHPNFRFEWRNALDWRRDGHLLRCVFVGARHQLDTDRLVLLNPHD